MRRVASSPVYNQNTHHWGNRIEHLGRWIGGRVCSYDHDGMTLSGKSTDFLLDERFQKAYSLGIESGHRMMGPDGNADLHIEWRVHIACWAASYALHLPGSFVECGVNTGIMSLAVCSFVDFNNTGKDFYLFDTFSGIPESQMSETERTARLQENQKLYEECYDRAVANFKPFPRAHLIRGTVPETLTSVNIESVCYLSIDMNIAAPERAAMEFFWERLSPGAVVLLDDYGWQGYSEQKAVHDSFASAHGVAIATLPTGQGLILKS
jgi:hypothetical protein